MSYLHIHKIGKAYKRYYKRWHRMAEWLGMEPRHELRWVLKDISFDVAPGEAVGIIGVNGAGKSTLLKIITGTTKPTTGTVEAGGRISALLELGMGFHPEFTGRQNAYMSAQLHGLMASEVDEKIQAIEEFAEIGDYFDQPVRTYSSGMLVRLGFSVATASLPDILIIDEALSVGDVAFQRKCYRKIENFRQNGGTLLFVSHDIETIKKICTKVVYLDSGIIKSLGASKNVCNLYEKDLFGGNSSKIFGSEEKIAFFDNSLRNINEVQYGTGEAEIVHCWIEDESKNKVNVLPSGKRYLWKYLVRFNQTINDVVFGMMLKTKDGICVFSTSTKVRRKEKNNYLQGDEIIVSFRFSNWLAPGFYYLNAGISKYSWPETTQFIHRRVDTVIIKVSNDKKYPVDGLLDLDSEFEILPNQN